MPIPSLSTDLGLLLYFFFFVENRARYRDRVPILPGVFFDKGELIHGEDRSVFFCPVVFC